MESHQADLPPKNKFKHRRKPKMTQGEKLAEAQRTEQMNLRSLDYKHKEKLEKYVRGMMRRDELRVKFISTTFPDLEQTTGNKHESQPYPPLARDSGHTEPSVCGGVGGHYARNFVVCEDEASLKSCFPSMSSREQALASSSSRKRRSTGYLCPVTGQKAKYMDPVTHTPYANIDAFKTIRERYYQKMKAVPESQRSDRDNEFIASYSKTHSLSS